MKNRITFLDRISECEIEYIEEVLGRSSKGGKQHLHLFIFGSGGKERSSSEYFEDETAQTPDINFIVIGFHEHNFWGPIIPTLYVGELFPVGKAGRSKVDQFDS